MQDIMDGYFPSELQDRYPDGVPIKVQLGIITLNGENCESVHDMKNYVSNQVYNLKEQLNL